MSRITFSVPRTYSTHYDIYAVGYDENRFKPENLKHIDPKKQVRSEAEASLTDFKATIGETSVHFSNLESSIATRSMLVGLGNTSKLNSTSLRQALTACFTAALKVKARSLFLQLNLSRFINVSISAYEFGRLVAETASMVNYEINHQKTEIGGYKPSVRLEKIDVCISTFDDIQALESGLTDGALIGEAVNLAKDLINAPADDMTPKALAFQARAIAKSSNNSLKVKVHGPKALERMKAGCILAVAKAGLKEERPVEPPALIELNYKPANAKPGVKLSLVGKSITFDSGGLDIKGTANMRDMKGDMAGGAAELAAMQVIAALKLPITVQALLPATPNLIGSRATKPGAVVYSMSGRSVEIDNTDAEGRLTLADGITFAKKNGATHIVDIATLTGAVFYALGPNTAGLFSNDKSLSDLVDESSKAAGEQLWLLPSGGEFNEANKTPIADIKNSGGGYGAGASTAASFVLLFAEDTPTVHLDIAGVSMKQMQATGFGVRTLIEVARQLSQTTK